MKLQWGNHHNLDAISPANGFGYATERVVTSLINLGHEVTDQATSADVEFWFDQPHWINWKTNDAVRIAYVPWESTSLMPSWLHKLNSADEVWTPSPIIAEWLVKAGVNVPVYVFQHGVDSIWTPALRKPETPFRLFHHGGEAARKGWDLTAQLFFEHFSSKDAEMNFKMQLPGWNIPVPKVNVVQGKMPIDELVAMYHRQNLMVYPSWGEGFGLVPLQAMATGMPVLISKGWAPYEHMLPPECLIETELVDSPWPNLHPGKMLKPNYDDMAHKALHIYENYEEFARNARLLAPVVTHEYQWDDLTRAAFDDLASRWKFN